MLARTALAQAIVPIQSDPTYYLKFQVEDILTDPELLELGLRRLAYIKAIDRLEAAGAMGCHPRVRSVPGFSTADRSVA